jgi:mevalonate pyrophosphate decarboxylase
VAENPEASFGEVGKILAEKWKGISEERRENYKAKAAELKAEYDKKVAAAGGKASSSASAKAVCVSTPFARLHTVCVARGCGGRRLAW